MGGPSGSSINTQNAITQQSLNISQQQQTQANQNYERMNQLEAPAISYYQGLTSGNPGLTNQAAAPLISQITGQSNAAKEQINNNIPAGAARDYALSQAPLQQNSQIASTLNNVTTGAYDKLANIGAGLGSFSLQDVGASLSGLNSASSSNQSIMQEQEQAKASTMGVFGSLLGAAGTAAGGGVFGKLSDRRSKKNVRELPSVLDDLSQIPVVEYEYVGTTSPQIGVMAQDVERFFPQAVLPGPLLSVDYAQVASLSLRAVQELLARIEHLEDRLSLHERMA